MPELPRFLTIKETAQALNLKVPTIREMIYRGVFEIVRASERGKVLISEAELQKWIAAHTTRYQARATKARTTRKR